MCAQEVSGVASTASHYHEDQERLGEQREMIDELEKSSPLNVAKANISISSVMLETELQRLERELDLEPLVPQEDMGVEVSNVMGVQTAENTFYKEPILQGEQAAAMEEQPVEEEEETVETRRLSIARIMLENERKRGAMQTSSNDDAPWDARYVTATEPISREPASSQPDAETKAHLISPREDIVEAPLLQVSEEAVALAEKHICGVATQDTGATPGEKFVLGVIRVRRPQWFLCERACVCV